MEFLIIEEEINKAKNEMILNLNKEMVDKITSLEHMPDQKEVVGKTYTLDDSGLTKLKKALKSTFKIGDKYLIKERKISFKNDDTLTDNNQ